jgi:GNAT superfamily N-acetyltransferase
MADFIIEQAGAENYPELLFLLQQLAEYENLAGPDAEAQKRLKTDLLDQPPKYEAFIGRLDDRPIGCITFFLAYSTFIALPVFFIEDLFVLEEYRKRGYGEQLFAFCQKEALKRGCGRIEWRVLTWNEPSIRFYEKTGAARLNWHTYRLECNEFNRELR